MRKEEQVEHSGHTLTQWTQMENHRIYVVLIKEGVQMDIYLQFTKQQAEHQGFYIRYPM